MNGVFLKEGEQVEKVDTSTGVTQLDLLEDERHYETGDVEKRVTAPDSNRKIIEEIKKFGCVPPVLSTVDVSPSVP
jgi:type I restriction enzyme R subunit